MALGKVLGFIDGWTVGLNDGWALGFIDGEELGSTDGENVGKTLGLTELGAADGKDDGVNDIEGIEVGS